jgi:YVTN family beta-propeller protein
MHKEILIIIFSLLIISCSKETNPVIGDLNESFLSGKGVFILNEGNYRSGNGSLSFFSYDSLKIFNHVFMDVNQRPLGDIPYSMSFHGSEAYIVVNNSGKIEVVNSDDLISVATIDGIISPRFVLFINDAKAYVTSLYSDSVTILDLSSNSISGYINLKKTSESIVVLHSTAYVANWAGGNKIMVINADSDQVIDSIEVGAEPESMVIDKSETLWVLCNGGWKREYFAELIGINTRTNDIEKRYIFPSITDSPTCLQIDKKGEILFFILNGIRRMNIDAIQLPAEIFIPDPEYSFYKMGVNPDNGEIFVTDAVDYIQKGNIIRYNKEGALISEMQADIIPGGLCFKVNSESDTE